MVKDIVDKAEKGEKTGNVECPYCGGIVNYAYENGMAMRAKCLQCGFYLMA
jgi:DNA-directed RNA polymerase subunit RPC12/RpoP